MTRALVVLGAVRALIDLADALDELAHRFGVDPLGVHGQAGEWDLDADVNLSRFALGVLWERDGDRDPLAPTTTVLAAHLGPLTLAASRQRPAGWTLPATPADCSIAAPLSDADLVALELDDGFGNRYPRCSRCGDPVEYAYAAGNPDPVDVLHATAIGTHDHDAVVEPADYYVDVAAGGAR